MPYEVLTGDARDEETLQAMLEAAGGRFDVLLSDMSPKLTGIKEADRAATAAISDLALWVSQRCLKDGGSFVIKVFKSPETDLFVKQSRAMFNKLIRVELDASRKSSKEYYLVGSGFKNSLPE